MLQSSEKIASATISEMPQNASVSLMGRRKLIGSLGLFCASTLTGNAALFWDKSEKNQLPIVKVKSGNSAPSKQIGGFPEEWERLQGQNLKNYAAYIQSLKMKNISAQDVLMAHAKKRGNVWNMLPPKQWWTRMGYTLRVVDRISSELNSPIEEIISAYRSPNYNARCRGAKKHSYHLANLAVDVKMDTSPRNVAAASRTLRDKGLFKGGVGRYYSFTHIDTRGENINW